MADYKDPDEFFDARIAPALSLTSHVDGSPQTVASVLGYIDEHVAVHLPGLLRVKSRVNGQTYSLSDLLGFMDEHVAVHIPDRLAAIEKQLAAIAAKVGVTPGN